MNCELCGKETNSDLWWLCKNNNDEYKTYVCVCIECDEVEVSDIGRFETTLLELIRAKHSDVLTAIRDSGELSDETETKLREIIAGFTGSFV